VYHAVAAKGTDGPSEVERTHAGGGAPGRGVPPPRSWPLRRPGAPRPTVPLGGREVGGFDPGTAIIHHCLAVEKSHGVVLTDP